MAPVFLEEGLFMRRIGLDLALRSAHRAVVFEDARPVSKSLRVPRTKEGFDELERRAELAPGEHAEVIMEPTGLCWLTVAAEMRRRGHAVFVPKGQKTSALRKFYSAFAKTDAIDAQAQALIRHVDPNGVHELALPTPNETSLRMFIKQRARLVEEMANSKNRIHGWLILANPHLSEAFGRALFSKIGKAFLRQYLDPFKARKLGKTRLRAFWSRTAHGGVKDATFERVFNACATSAELYAELRKEGALPFSYDELEWLFSQELDRIEFLEKQIASFERKIADFYTLLDPQRTLQNEVPGCGEITAAAIEAYVGDVSRFDNIKAFAAFFGLVPRTTITGDRAKKGQRLTKGGPKLLKKYLFLAADVARRADPELAATYAHALARGKHHYVALVIVAHKLIRKVYAVLRRRAAKSDTTYRLVDDNGATLTRKQARQLVADKYPSKAKLAARRSEKKKATAASSIDSGSSEDATTDAAAVAKTSIQTGTPSANKAPKKNHDRSVFSLEPT
ncbi:IS110 family transposase [Endomicrobium sp. AH-315-J14]|nr:IS110 family transposase [Endomicrobium sp. AH-315-J14]MBN4059062.1 IS110 family transposase [Endomicrobium sp. AH-315-J14]